MIYFPFFLVEAICIFHYTNYNTRRGGKALLALPPLLLTSRTSASLALQAQILTRPNDLPRPSRSEGKDRSWCHDWEYSPSARSAPLPAGRYLAPAGFLARVAARP